MADGEAPPLLPTHPLCSECLLPVPMSCPPNRIQYAEEVPEWKMEKNRYYVELPGDVWEEGELMRLIKDNQEKRVGALHTFYICI